MNIDEISYELYKNEHKEETIMKQFDSVMTNCITFDLFCYYKKCFKNYYDKALIIERQNKINKLL